MSNTQDLFLEMKDTLEKKERWHRTKSKLFEGKHVAETLGISLSEDMDRKIPAKLDWFRIAVDAVADQLNFDVLLNDHWGANKVLQNANCDMVFDSAIRRSLISACSFVSVVAGDTDAGEPPVVLTAYTGSEATGIYNQRTNTLEAGLVVSGYSSTFSSSGLPSEWQLFLPDGIYEISEGGRTFTKIGEGIGAVQLVPFVFRQDVAARPFGESRISEASVDLLDRALRVYKRMELSSETLANPQRYVAIRTSEIEDGMTEESQNKLSEIGKYLTYVGNADEVRIGELNAHGPDGFLKFLGSISSQFASAMLMEPSDFGVEAANGSLSSETLIERKRKMGNLLSKAKRSYGASIKNIAEIALLIRDGEVDRRFSDVETRWLSTVGVKDYGALGDAIGKVQEVAPSLQNEQFVLDTLGISMRGRTDEAETLTGRMSDGDDAE